MQRAVLGHQSVYGYLGTGRSAGLILRDCVTSGEPATEQRDAIATRDVSERRSYPSVNEKGHRLPADVDIDALPLSSKVVSSPVCGCLPGTLIVMCLAISHLRLGFKMVGHNARLWVDTDKRRGLRVVLIEPRQFSAKRLNVWCNHMTGIPRRR